MRRCAALALTILSITTLSAALSAVSPGTAHASSTAEKLWTARAQLRDVKVDLASLKADYQAFRSAGALRGVGWYKLAIIRQKRRAAGLRDQIRLLERRLAEERLQKAASRGDWAPLIRAIAAENGISAAGLYRLMSLESGGRASVSTGTYHGLYQYCSSTWRGAWNPWRSRSIYNGEAQIRATARAIKKGWGPRMWPNTFPIAF